MAKKVLYIHSNSLDLNHANMHQVMAMCNAFGKVGLLVTLAVPRIPDELFNLRLKALQRDYNVDFHITTYSDSQIERLLVYAGYNKLRGINFRDYDFVFTRVPSILPRIKFRQVDKVVYEAHNSLIHQTNRFLDAYWIWKLNHIQRKNKYYLLGISEALAKYYRQKKFDKNYVISEHDGFHFNKSDENRNLDVFENYRRQYQKICIYTGSMAKNRGLSVILDYVVKRPDVLFLLVGGNSEQNQYWSEKLNVSVNSNVVLYGRVSHDMVEHMLSCSDVLLAIWSKTIKTIMFCSPLKLFEYLSIGKPIVIAEFPTIKEVVNKDEVFFFEADNKQSFAQVMDRCLSSNFDDVFFNNLVKKSKYYTWESRVKRILEKISF